MRGDQVSFCLPTPVGTDWLQSMWRGFRGGPQSPDWGVRTGEWLGFHHACAGTCVE